MEQSCASLRACAHAVLGTVGDGSDMPMRANVMIVLSSYDCPRRLHDVCVRACRQVLHGHEPGPACHQQVNAQLRAHIVCRGASRLCACSVHTWQLRQYPCCGCKIRGDAHVECEELC